MKKVPNFKSIEEEAKFWDSHSTADYPEYWSDAKNVKFAKNLSSNFDESLPMRLDKATKQRIEKVAKDKGIKVSSAARMLILERLAQLR